MWNKKFLKLFLVLSILNSGCSSYSPVAPNPDVIELPGSNTPSIPNSNTNNSFINDLSNLNINLSNSEIETVRNYIKVQPKDNWAFSDSKTSKQLLIEDFLTLKDSFNSNLPEDEEDYKNRAVMFSKSQNFYANYYFDTNFYNKRKKILVIKWDSQTKEFILINLNGRISNYQLTNNIEKPRYIKIPNNL